MATETPAHASTDAALAELLVRFDEAETFANEHQLQTCPSYQQVRSALAALREVYSDDDRTRLMQGRVFKLFGVIDGNVQELETDDVDRTAAGFDSVAVLVELAAASLAKAAEMNKVGGKPLDDLDDLRVRTSWLRLQPEQDAVDG
jgi:hypothetical protein